jgi:hypothetical protein
MKLVRGNLLSRVFGASGGVLVDFQIEARVGVENAEAMSQEAFEDLTESVLDVLLERGKGTALGPVAAYNLDRGEIELMFTVEAASAEELHKKIGHVFRLLEDHSPIRVEDTSASRLAPDPDPDPECVPA